MDKTKYDNGILVCAEHNKPIQKQVGELGGLFCPQCELERLEKEQDKQWDA